MHKVGRFTITAYRENSYPPSWIDLSHEHDEGEWRFSAEELEDLQYAVQWALRQVAEGKEYERRMHEYHLKQKD